MSEYSALDMLADPALIVGARTRLMIAETLAGLLEAEGTVSAATLRPALIDAGVPRDHLDKRMAALIGTAARKGVLEWTGAYVPSGNRHSRNGNRAVRVYRAASPAALADWVSSYEAAFTRDRQTQANLIADATGEEPAARREKATKP